MRPCFRREKTRAGFHDPRLVPRNFLERLPENVRVVVINVRDRGDARISDDIGRIITAAAPHLKHRPGTALALEINKRHRKKNFKIRWPAVWPFRIRLVNRGFHVLYDVGKCVGRNVGPAHFDFFNGGCGKWRGE